MRENPYAKTNSNPKGYRSNRSFFSQAGVDSADNRDEDDRLTLAPVILDREAPPETLARVSQSFATTMGEAPWISSSLNHANDYARLVGTGEIIAGPHVRAACRRHLGDWENQYPRSILWFDKGAYDWFALFCLRWLRFYQGQYYGSPFNLEPAQEFIFGNMFGWRMWREGYPEDEPWNWPRRFQRCYLEMGKGNGKTPGMGAVALYGLLADRERGAEIYIGASKQKQAHVCFDDAVRMSRASPLFLRDGFRVTGVSPPTRIDYLPTESFIDLLSSESKNSESGVKPHFVLLDEVHEHKDSLLIDMMQRGFKWRRQPMLIMSTNSGWDMTSAAWEEHEHGKKVSHGEIQSEESFAYVCAMDDGDEPLEDSNCWVKANPLIGIAQTTDALNRAVADAKSYPTRVNNIRRLHFCQWTEGETSWVSKDLWMSLEHKDGDGWHLLLNRPVIASIDLADSGDLTGLCYTAQTGYTDDGKAIYTSYVRAYLPGANLRERIDHDRRPYDEWARLNPDMLRIVPGPVIDHDTVAQSLIEDHKELDIRALVYDSHRFDAFTRALILLHWPSDIPLVEHPQGWNRPRGKPLSMSGSIGVFERYIQQKRIRVHVNPILRAAVVGAVMQTSTTGQKKWNKDVRHARIDPLVAMTMTLGAWEVGLENLVESDRVTSKKDFVKNFYRQYTSAGDSGFEGLVA